MDTRIRGPLALVASIVLVLGGVAPGFEEGSAPPRRAGTDPDACSLVPAKGRPLLEPATRSDLRTAGVVHPAVRGILPSVQARGQGFSGILARVPSDLFLIQAFILLHYLDFRESLSAP